MVMSYSSQVPHLVTRGANGQYKCDSKCLHWTSSALCSHSLAVAEVNNELLPFLKWYNSSTIQPNVTTIAMSGLPSGRGRKGGVPKRQRSRAEKKTPESYVLRPAFQEASPALQTPVFQVASPVIQTPVVPSNHHSLLFADQCLQCMFPLRTWQQ